MGVRRGSFLAFFWANTAITFKQQKNPVYPHQAIVTFLDVVDGGKDADGGQAATAAEAAMASRNFPGHLLRLSSSMLHRRPLRESWGTLSLRRNPRTPSLLGVLPHDGHLPWIAGAGVIACGTRGLWLVV